MKIVIKTMKKKLIHNMNLNPLLEKVLLERFGRVKERFMETIAQLKLFLKFFSELLKDY